MREHLSSTGATPPATSTRVIATLLRQCTWRHWCAQPVRTLLLVLLLSIGVSVFLSIRLANRAAVASFTQFSEVLTQQTDAVLTPRAGLLSEEVLDSLKGAMRKRGDEISGLEQIIPIVETIAALPNSGDSQSIGDRPTFTLLGVDLVSLQNFADSKTRERSWFNQQSKNENAPSEQDFHALLSRDDVVFCSAALAHARGFKIGDKLRLVINERIAELEIAGFIPVRAGQPNAPENLLVIDLPALQRLSGKEGRLDRVEFLLTATARKQPSLAQATLAALTEASETHGTLRTSESRQGAAEVMTRGFRLNLTILSLIALLVGLYLIFQTLDAAVVKRRAETGVLRALGVTADEVRRAWMWEALLLGCAGGILGTLGGWALAQGTVRAVSQTVNSLYYATNATAAALHPGEALQALVLAIVSSLTAGWIPARRAATTPPAQLWAQSTEGRPSSGLMSNRWNWMGALLTTAACILALCPPLRLPGGTPFALGGYLAALIGIVGVGILAGEVLPLVGWLAKTRSMPSPARLLAHSHLRHPTSRHRWAVAGLVCAIAMTGGMAVLVASFESSVSSWINHTLQADLYLTSGANQNASANNRISAATWKAIVANTAVQDWDAFLMAPIEMPRGPVRLSGCDLSFSKRHEQLVWLAPPLTDAVFDPALNAHLCLVSESFSQRYNIPRGASVQVPTPSGNKTLTVEGIYTDYGDEKGIILVSRTHMQSWFQTEQVSTLTLVLRPDSDAESTRARLRADFPALVIYTNAHLRGEVMRIFRQTFAITYALEGIGVIIALAGLGITLASILAERRAELTTLRAIGMEHAQIAKVAAWEGVLLSATATAAGLLASVGLGALLVFVINKQTFGWTLQLSFPRVPLLLLSLLIPASGGLVSWIVGRWGADLPADRAE